MRKRSGISPQPITVMIDREWDDDQPRKISESEARTAESPSEPRRRPARSYQENGPDLCDPRPTKEQIADRDIRAMLPHRDLVGTLLGDPPIGRSALDKKKRLE